MEFRGISRMVVFWLVTLMSVLSVEGFPTGAPVSACGHLMPVHIDGVLQEVASPYVLVLNDTVYGNTPLKLSVTTVGPNARNFMAFMLQARSEFGEPAGYFTDMPVAAKTITCYGDADTLTHTAAFIRPAMEVLWHPPPKNIGKISIQGSIAVTKADYWAVESQPLKGQGKLDLSGTRGRGGAGGNAGKPTMEARFVVICALLASFLSARHYL